MIVTPPSHCPHTHSIAPLLFIHPYIPFSLCSFLFIPFFLSITLQPSKSFLSFLIPLFNPSQTFLLSSTPFLHPQLLFHLILLFLTLSHSVSPLAPLLTPALIPFSSSNYPFHLPLIHTIFFVLFSNPPLPPFLLYHFLILPTPAFSSPLPFILPAPSFSPFTSSNFPLLCSTSYFFSILSCAQSYFPLVTFFLLPFHLTSHSFFFSSPTPFRLSLRCLSVSPLSNPSLLFHLPFLPFVIYSTLHLSAIPFHLRLPPILTPPRFILHALPLILRPPLSASPALPLDPGRLSGDFDANPLK